MNEAKYIGLDVHQATISAAVRDSAGNLVMEATLETKAETILEFAHGLRGSLHVSFEEGTWAADATSLPYQATIVGLLRPGAQNVHQRRLPLRWRPT